MLLELRRLASGMGEALKWNVVDTWDIKYNMILKVQSCKLYNNKHMIASTQITKTEIFAFTPVLVYKLMSRKVLFINKKGNRNY